MHRNIQPYREYIKLEQELSEYRKLCKRQSKKYNFYLEWKKHIIEVFLSFDSYEKRENFKHYLISNKRVNKNIDTGLVAILIFVFTAYYMSMSTGDFISNLICILFIMICILSISIYNNRGYCFYCDLIEIMDEIQTFIDDIENKNKTVIEEILLK